MLTAEHVSVRYGEKTVLQDVSLHLKEGQWLMLAGPNGAGKSTFIRAVSQGVPYRGTIRIGSADIRRFRPAVLAQHIGVLAQNNHVSYDYTVEEIVSLGRYAHSRGIFDRSDAGGKAGIDRALHLTGMDKLRHASVLNLSGGELQRAFLAQVFAQDPKILILDEPANHLDLVYQKHIFAVVSEWLRTPGRAVLSVVHDLSLAKKFGTHGALLHCGRLAASGEISQALSPEKLNQVYGMDVQQWMHDMLSQW